MPAYKFHALPRVPASSGAERLFFSDDVAMMWALRSAGPGGVEVWQGDRFVGQLYAAGQPVGAAEQAAVAPPAP